jgi:hypothetical protein
MAMRAEQFGWLIVVSAAVFGAMACLSAVQAGSASRTAPSGVRVGTYDARAVAVAFAHSDIWDRMYKARKAEMDQAKAKGDSRRVQELKAWGKTQQQRLHRQGFAGAPVDDILAHVKDRLQEVADKTGVVVITREADYVAPAVERVDVTDELVKLFDPKDKTLKIIQDLRKRPALSIEEVDKMEENE